VIVRGHDTVLVHGGTGKQGTFWTERMIAYGTNVVGAVSPSKAGEDHLGRPVYASAREAAADRRIDVSVLFVPPGGALSATLDALAAGVRTVVVLTEFVPVHDTMRMIAAADASGARIVGPNTAGVVTPGESFVGFMPAFDDRIFRPGNVGVVSRSGSLGTLACLELTRAGLGQSAFIGVGGDPVSGASTRDAFVALDADPATEVVVLIGEIGGRKEEDAARAIVESATPVVAFVAGAAAPVGQRMGHAGAIVEGASGTHASKVEALRAAGATVVDTPWLIPPAVEERMQQ